MNNTDIFSTNTTSIELLIEVKDNWVPSLSSLYSFFSFSYVVLSLLFPLQIHYNFLRMLWFITISLLKRIIYLILVLIMLFLLHILYYNLCLFYMVLSIDSSFISRYYRYFNIWKWYYLYWKIIKLWNRIYSNFSYACSFPITQ